MRGRSQRGNLPIELTEFVGRRRELSQVRQRLGAARLVTLTGMGGIGKTRLALRAGGQSERAFPDGVWFVELAAVRDGELVPAAVAVVLGVAERSGRSTQSTLEDYLRDRRLLLILDNCEHLVDACASLLTGLLAAAPGLRVLATSREALRVAGEYVFGLDPLPAPDPARLPSGDLSEFAAVRLFVQHARAVQPDFEVTAANRGALAEVCHRLEGIPLALELAARWVRALSVRQILDRLDDRFRLLTRGARTAPARHRTLLATLDWSYWLCPPAEQTLWTRTSVFSGGFDLDAVEQVCSGDGITSRDVVELLTALLDKSIVVLLENVGTTARYGLLETSREYAQQRLYASGQQTVLRSRHRDYCQQMLRQAATERISPQEVQWLLRLRSELPNLRSAMEFSLGAGDDANAALQIAAGLRDVWHSGGRKREGLAWLTRTAAADTRATPTRQQALADASVLALQVGEVATSERLLAEACALADRLHDPYAAAAVAFARSVRAHADPRSDPAHVRVLVERALEAARAAGDLRRISVALLNAAVTAASVGDPRAADYADECRRLGQTHGAEWTQAWGMTMLALVGTQRDDLDQAVPLLREALIVHRTLQDSVAAGIGLAVLARCAIGAGECERAARLLGACEAIKRREGSLGVEFGPYRAWYVSGVGEVRSRLSDNDYQNAFAAGTHLTLDEAIDFALHEHGQIPAPRHDPAAGSVSDRLTRREKQVADLVAQGLTNRDIAVRLFLSVRTVESHVQHILHELDLTNRSQIAAWTVHSAPDCSPIST